MANRWGGMETVADFIFLGSKITADGDCSHEIKRYLILEGKAMTKLDSILKKQKHHVAHKGLYSQSYDFSSRCVWMWDWIIKKAGIFELWYWRRLFRVPWTARRSNKSMLKEINPEYTLEELMLKLKLRYFGHSCEELIHWKRCWCWEKLRAGGEGDDRGRDGWMASLTQRTWVWASFGRQ